MCSCCSSGWKKENIAGLIVDLRRNGGGSLEEAIALTGFFEIGTGSCKRKARTEHRRLDRSRPWHRLRGSAVVLTSRQSASASEIFAAALPGTGGP